MLEDFSYTEVGDFGGSELAVSRTLLADKIAMDDGRRVLVQVSADRGQLLAGCRS